MGWGEGPAKEQTGWGGAPAEEQMGRGADTGARHSEAHGDRNKAGSDPGSGNGFSADAPYEPPAMLTREERLAKIKAAMAKLGTFPSRQALLENAKKVRTTAPPSLGTVYFTTVHSALLKHACNADSEAELTSFAALVALGNHDARPHIFGRRCCRKMRSAECGVRPKKRRPRQEASPSRGVRSRPCLWRTTSTAGTSPLPMLLP